MKYITHMMYNDNICSKFPLAYTLELDARTAINTIKYFPSATHDVNYFTTY